MEVVKFEVCKYGMDINVYFKENNWNKLKNGMFLLFLNDKK